MRLQAARCFLVSSSGNRFILQSYAKRESFVIDPLALSVLHFFLRPRVLQDALLSFSPHSPHAVAATIEALVAATLLLEPKTPEWTGDRSLADHWKPWLPAGAFHFMTKDATYVGGDWTPERKMATVSSGPPPPQLKGYPHAPLVPLPAPQNHRDSFFETLHKRRTHRQFSSEPLSLSQVSSVLFHTWGIQGFLRSPFFGDLPFKTSPSGGARHPIECYVLALRVSELAAGIYHYHAGDHELRRIKDGLEATTVREYCADQVYPHRAAAVFVMTAIFKRTMWKYHKPRAYRVVLLDAGHLAQTFCLVATRLGLAPFSTAAFKDSLIEEHLGIDGVSESALYVTGLGVPAS